MVAHEECIVGSDIGAQIFDGGFVVRRPVGELDERLLARQRIEACFRADALGQPRRKIEHDVGLGFGRKQSRDSGARPGENRSYACCLEQVATCNHSALPHHADSIVSKFRPRHQSTTQLGAKTLPHDKSVRTKCGEIGRVQSNTSELLRSVILPMVAERYRGMTMVAERYAGVATRPVTTRPVARRSLHDDAARGPHRHRSPVPDDPGRRHGHGGSGSGAPSRHRPGPYGSMSMPRRSPE